MSPIHSRAGIRLGYAAVAASAVLFSAKAVFIKMSFAHGAQPTAFAALRTMACLPFFGGMAFAAWSRERKAGRSMAPRDLATVAGLGFLGYYVSSMFNVHGLQYVTAGMERMILFIYPTLVVLFSALAARKRLDPSLILPLVLSYAGIALSYGAEAAAGGGSRPHLGALLVFVSAVCYAVFLVMQAPLIPRLGPHRITSYSMLFGSGAVLAHFLIMHPVSDLRQGFPVYGLAILTGSLCTVAPAYLLGYGIARIGTGPAAVVSSVGPVSTLVLAMILLGEKAGWAQVAGFALVVGGGLRLGLAKSAASGSPRKEPAEAVRVGQARPAAGGRRSIP